MNDISIIGATSHVGVHLVSHLTKLGYRVRATYRSDARVPDSWYGNDSIDCIRLDLSETSDLKGLLAENVVWLAHLDQGRFNEQETETNLGPFERFLNAAAGSDVKQITFISSGGSVYGEAIYLPITEEHPREPLSSYGKAKRAMEDALTAFGRMTTVHTAIVRPGNIYGFESPDKDTKGIVGAFLHAISERKPFTLIDNGETVRDFVHIDDVVRAIVCAIDAEQKEIVWNAGTGVPSRIADVLDLILKRSGLAPPEFIHQPNYASDVQTNLLSTERIARESGWIPAIDLGSGIDEVVRKWIGEIATV
jgi:UDP-glucose 4-epimerase